MIILPDSTESQLEDGYGFEVSEFFGYYDKDNGASPQLMQLILSKAKKSIYIWDSHFTVEEDAQLFSQVSQEGLDIRILTMLHYPQDQKSIEQLKDNVKSNLVGNKIEKYKVVIQARKNVKSAPAPFHDRYLIIDNAEVFMVGNSMNSHVKPVKSTGIAQLTKGLDKVLVIQKFNEYWGKMNSVNSCKTSCHNS